MQVARTALQTALPLARRLFRGLVDGAYAVYVWTLFVTLGSLAWLAVMMSPRLKWRWRVTRGLSRFLFFAAGIKITVNGLENLPPESRVSVYVANHASYLDSIAVVAAIPRDFSFVAKQELRRSIVTGPALKRLGTRFVERFDKLRGVQDAREIAAARHRTQSLFFFPEGSFTRVSGLHDFHMGAFTTAATANMPVVPLSIRGTRSMLRPDTWMPRRGRITFTIGKAIAPDAGIEGGSDDEWAIAVKLKQAAHRHILEHCGEVSLHKAVKLPGQ
jgi:1-acyl-sn-glycerol-3-phosphate acyltransferase